MAAESYTGTVSHEFALNALPCNKEVGVRAWTLLGQPVTWDQSAPALLGQSLADLMQGQSDWQVAIRTQISVTTSVKAQPHNDPFLEVTVIGADLDQVAKQRFQGQKVGLRVYFDETSFRGFAVPQAVAYLRVLLGFSKSGSCPEAGVSPVVKISAKVKVTAREPNAQHTQPSEGGLATQHAATLHVARPSPAVLLPRRAPAVSTVPPAARENSPASASPAANQPQVYPALQNVPGVRVGAVYDPAQCTAKFGPCPPGYAYTGRILHVPAQRSANY